MEGLQLEWFRWLPVLKNKKIVSVYFGGGTPALLGAPAISKILSWIHSDLVFTTDNPEITLEANPENITKELMTEYASAGINRVSIGIQTLDPHLLKVLERLHSAQKALDAIWMTREAGIKNISVDLMYDLPGQTLDIWNRTLKEIQQLPITHLSLYNLTIEPHTLFFKQQEVLRKQLPDPDTSLQMYENAISVLAEGGLEQYEISAFARDGKWSQHNVGYWTARPFLGLGPSAFSYWDNKRFRNVANLSRYCKALLQGDSPIDFSEELSPEARRQELLAVQLRLLHGVDLALFQQKHGTISLGPLEQLQKEGLVLLSEGRARLTKRGVLFYDTVASELI